jgi:hypothetical protein
MSSAAQEEFDRLESNNRHTVRSHPEDRHDSDNESHHSDDHAQDRYDLSDADSDYADRQPDKMVSRTSTVTVPSTVFEANTGPKGVIADAQSFERARKKSFRRTLLSVAGLDSYAKPLGHKEEERRLQKGSPPSENEEDEFMRRWRQSRLEELQQRSQRRHSPSKRVWGTVDQVDAEGYLNAIERVSSDTVVVVCIYDLEVRFSLPSKKPAPGRVLTCFMPQSSLSAQVEDALSIIARKQPTTRFIKLDHDIAEMNHIDAPALLVYKGGDVIATIVDIPRQISRGREVNATSIENLLKQYVSSNYSPEDRSDGSPYRNRIL